MRKYVHVICVYIICNAYGGVKRLSVVDKYVDYESVSKSWMRLT